MKHTQKIGRTLALAVCCVAATYSSAQAGFRFVEWSDSAGETQGVAAVAAQIRQLNVAPAFSIFPGDIYATGYTPADGEALRSAMDGGASNGLSGTWFPVRGNHDKDADVVPWQAYLNVARRVAGGDLAQGVPGIGGTNYAFMSGCDSLTYSFDYQNSHFAGIDVPGSVSGITAPQIAWLDTDLAAAEARGLQHAFLYWHGPAYSCGKHCCDTAPAALIAALNKHPIVSAVFGGHDHVFAWTHMDSNRVATVTHPFEAFIAGPCGESPYDSIDRTRCDYGLTGAQGFATIDVNGPSFTISFYVLSNAVPVFTRTFPDLPQLPERTSIQEAIQRANDHFIASNAPGSNTWAQAVYHSGNLRAAQVLELDRYRQWSLDWASLHQWLTGDDGPANPGGQACGQVYLDLYRVNPEPIRIAAIQSAIDARLAVPESLTDWSSVEGFYLAAPVLARLGNLQATNSYTDKLASMYEDMKTRRGLFDPTTGLWYRDEAAQTARTSNGQKQFWGPGNGWIMAGLVQVIEQLPPADPQRAGYIAMLQTMAAALKPLQQADGLWRASLLDGPEVPNPETTGTSLFTFALAWGIRQGHLSASDYQGVVAQAWNGLVTTSLQADGKVGYVQPPTGVPTATDSNTTYDFGVGAFLLTGSEVLLLAGGRADPPVVLSQPLSRSLDAGSLVVFSVAVSGSPPLSYQWWGNGSLLVDGDGVSGTRTPSLMLSNVQTAQAGSYFVVVSNVSASVVSSNAVLTVIPPGPPVITSQPANHNADPGSTVQFDVTVAGTPPFTYQWWGNGVQLTNGPSVQGAATATLTLSNIQPAQAGSYWVVVSNVADTVISSNAVLTLTPVSPLAEALDAPGWIWTTTGSAAWAGQTNVTHDGLGAGRSGSVADSQLTSMQTTVNGPGSLSFWWKVSSETNQDLLIFFTNGVELARISGEVDWQQRVFALFPGSQVLKWTYSKDSSGTAGEDRAWVDQVQCAALAPVILTQPVDQRTCPGSSLSLSVQAIGTGPLSWQWRCDGTNLVNGAGVTGATTPTLVLSNLQPLQAGLYSVVVTNLCGRTTSASASVAVWPGGVPEAVNAPYLVWSMAGNTGWVAQVDVAHDGVAAGQSGAITDGQNSRLETWVTGPGTISFWWKVSSEPNNDRLQFYINSTIMAAISGEVDWQWQSFSVPSGTNQLLKWRYGKNASLSAGQDRGWVDQIQYASTDGYTLPAITSQPEDQAVSAGGAVTFSAIATGSGPLGYQWRFNGAELVDGPGVSGCMTPVLRLTNLQATNAGNYQVVVSNPAGSVSSSLASLTVTTPPAITVVASSNKLSLTWRANAGRTYQVFYKDNLGDTIWKAFPAGVTIQGSTATFEDLRTENAQRFYLVQEN